MRQVRRSPFEIIVVAIVVVLTLLLAGGLYAGRLKVQKSNLLIRELSTLRSALTLYKTINRHNASSLEELAEGEYEVGGERRHFIENLPRSPDGAVVDPFGNPYAYDESSGWVFSTSSGYERW